MARNVENTSQLVDDIDKKILCCPVCRERFTAPKILPCVHTFCEVCLKTWVEKNGGQLTCPTCRKLHVIPPGGIRALNNNVFINEMLEMFSKVKIGQDVSKCDMCDSTALFWCKDCVEFFCQDCSVPHSRMRATKNHKLMTVEEYQEFEKSGQRQLIQPRFCTNHPDKQLELFCDVCQVTACTQCFLTDHNGSDHQVIAFEDALNKYTPNLHHLIDELDKPVTSLKSDKEKQDLAINQFKHEHISVEKQIKQHVAEIIEGLKKEEQSFLATVTEVFNTQYKELQAQMEHIELNLGRAESMQSYAKIFLQHGNPADILSVRKSLENEMKELGAIAPLIQDEIESAINLNFQKTSSPLLTIGEVTCKRSGSKKRKSHILTGTMPNGTMPETT
ncbi:E3 ubiquitin-protein ligase TRIM56-like [Saccoglossus kowalevskii]|uniref:E3 ubiquitin-protein ligase TRIM56-like n=1 Tax=Saccoglossus kowalevskii TaxID=10224 RepID=A0ABM0MD15_SACKO|nr:PREDICTED: E3 ubiquitin-protein ligase TRIM56-like [Saccoglossus kowalevskii]